VFGTVLNRFIIQAVLGQPLTVYGNGTQTRGYLNLVDTVECIRLACENPADRGEFRVFNQMTETFSLNQLAETIQREFPGEVQISHTDNPRVEMYDHYYNVVHTALPSLGLKPTLLADSLIDHMFDVVERYKGRVDPAAIEATVKWAQTSSELPQTAAALAQA
jgi:UDP-sulfoquinovose synthase